MRVQGCDRSCKSCALLELCGGTRQHGVRGYHCPMADCKMKSSALRTMSECSVCDAGRLTWEMSRGDVAKLVVEVQNLSEVPKPTIELPGVVPIVSLRDRRSFCWDSLEVEAVVISFNDLLDEQIRDAVLRAGDIHSYLDYDGKVLVSSIMPDDLITREDVFYSFVDFVKRVGFDAAIGWDSPVYVDIPLYDSWINLLMGLKLTHELARQEIVVIGLLKGNTERQIAFSAGTLARIGIKDMALHASEYMMVYKVDSHVRQILYTYIERISKLARSVLILGILRPSSLSYFTSIFPAQGPKLSASGLSWFLEAENGSLYSGGGNVDATSNFVECTCSACSRIKPRELMTDLRAKTRHNLNYLMDQVRDPSQPASASNMSTCDLFLERDESALLVSDLHLWTGRTLLDEFATFVRAQRPKNIVFLGDIFDFVKGKPDILETDALFSLLRDIGPLVLTTSGCSDSDQGQLLSALDRLTMEGRFRPMLYAEPDDVRFHDTVLDLYRFYRSSKEHLEIKLANQEIVRAEHGHRIVEDRHLPFKQAAERMEEARRRAHVSWLVTGHLHKAFIRDDTRVASTGSWVWDEPYESGKAAKEDLRTAVIVQGDGEVSLIRQG